MTENSPVLKSSRIPLAERLFGRGDEPLLWALAGLIFLSIAAGVAIAYLLGWQELAVFSVVPAVLTSLAMVKCKGPGRVRRAAILGVVAAGLGGLGVVASISPGLAAAIAVVVFGVATAMQAVPAWTLESNLIVLAYFLAAVGAIYVGVGGERGLHITALGLAGAFAGLLVTGLLAALIRRGRPRPIEEEVAAIAAPTETLAEGIRAMGDIRNSIVRFAVVRGLVLGGVIGLTMAAGADQSALWALFTLFAVMRPMAHDTLSLTGLRIAATFAGVVVIGLAGLFFPRELVVLLGIAGLLAGILFAARTRFLLSLGGTMLAVTLAAAPDGQYLTWGISRLAGTVVGGGIAVGILFVLMPAMNRIFDCSSAQERSQDSTKETENDG